MIKPVGMHHFQRFLSEHTSEHPWPLGEFHVFVNESLMCFRKECSSAPIHPVYWWGGKRKKPKILGTAACVQILILTVLFHQKRSVNRALSVKYRTCPLTVGLW